MIARVFLRTEIHVSTNNITLYVIDPCSLYSDDRWPRPVRRIR